MSLEHGPRLGFHALDFELRGATELPNKVFTAQMVSSVDLKANPMMTA